MPRSVADNRIAKLIRMLGSSRDGEVVAAARALVRELKSAGTDLHLVADLVGTSLVSDIDDDDLADIDAALQQQLVDRTKVSTDEAEAIAQAAVPKIVALEHRYEQARNRYHDESFRIHLHIRAGLARLGFHAQRGNNSMFQRSKETARAVRNGDSGGSRRRRLIEEDQEADPC
jgi:hypothetical protein